MKSLGDHILENANAARGARKKGQRDREPAAEAEPVRVIRSLDSTRRQWRCPRVSISRPGPNG